MLKRLIFLVFVGAVLAAVIRLYVIEGVYVASASMEPTLKVGSNFFLEKITYLFRRPARNDFVVFYSPVKAGHDSIKRVIAVEGETVELINKSVYINGKKLEEDYVKHTRPGEILAGDNLGPFEVPEDMLFVLGDNRDESEDSRDWVNKDTSQHIYFITLNSVKGKLVMFF